MKTKDEAKSAEKSEPMILGCDGKLHTLKDAERVCEAHQCRVGDCIR